MDLDQDVIVTQFGLRHFGDPAALLLAVTIDDEGFHGFRFFLLSASVGGIAIALIPPGPVL
ncbi:hypothetical protein ACU4HD_39685 [Cupriavidus basilensis]